MVKTQRNITMRKSYWFGFIITIVLLVGIVAPVFAQDYLFAVPYATIEVYINSDGTATIEYYYLFQNQTNAHPIDYVDIGLPNRNYSLRNVTADIDGNTITDITDSPYVSPGIALGLGSYAIGPGQSGTVSVRITGITGMLFTGSVQEAEEYASFNFEPNYFESQYVVGTTELTVNFHLPPGLTENEPRYFQPSNWPGNVDPASALDAENRIVYQWYSTSASSSGKYKFGASFPSRLVPVGVISSQQSVTFNISDVLESVIPFLCCGIFIFIIVLIIFAINKANQKRKMQYLPPKIAVEGHGIKRGLTAVEAGVLMEQPMDKILTMVMFSVLKKEAAVVIKRDPLELKVEEKSPEGLNTYEVDFLNAFRKPEKERRKALQDLMVSLVQNVGEKMKGFSRKETTDYYQSIIKKAWQQVEAAGTPEVKSQSYSENMDWTMLDKEYDTRTQRTFGTGPVWMPGWWWRVDPSVPRSTTTGRVSAPSAPSGGKSTTINLPRLPGADAAASVIGTVQGFSSKVVGDITSFTGGVTAKTNPLPVATSSGWKPRSGGSSGGFHSSCACACACAGCACACAGGGR